MSNSTASAKENSTVKTSTVQTSLTVGIDLGDKTHFYHVLNDEGETIMTGSFPNTKKALGNLFSKMEPATVVLEAGTHSRWVSEELAKMGHKVLVGNPRKLRAIWQNPTKCDEKDAEMLARIARVDPQLLAPITHRSEKCQADLAMLKSRDALVRSRASLVNHCRSVVKSFGLRLPSCSTESFAKKVRDELPEILRPALCPLVETIHQLSEKIKQMDRELDKIASEKYPETNALRKINGVGPLTSLGFVLTLESPERFDRSRSVAPFLGLVPRRDQSGQSDRQLRITKAGDDYLRRLLVSCAHYILGPFGQDCDLRRWGLKLCERGGKNAKKRAVVAVARKVTTLMHRLWAGDEEYDPFYNARRRGEEVPGEENQQMPPAA